MSTALQIPIPPDALALTPRSTAAIAAQRNSIVECMRNAMKEGIDGDYGTIPGTKKPSLFKPGSEKLLSLFHLAAEPFVEDLSTPDCMRFRVTVRITDMNCGRFLGAGIGEASSAEGKYQWRKSVCQQEWDEAPEDRKRKKWKKGSEGVWSEFQVRADMEDVANTILKMAKKRAQIDAVLTVTAASDVFQQDLEDLPPEVIQQQAEQNGNTAAAKPQTIERKADAPATNGKPAASGAVITEAQSRRFYAITHGR